MNSTIGYVTAAVMALLGGAGGWVTTQLEEGHVPTTTAQWKAVGLGALMAGLAALSTLFQHPPGQTAAGQNSVGGSK